MDASANDFETLVHDFLNYSNQIQDAFANNLSRICVILEPQVGHIPRNNSKALKAEFDDKIGPNVPLKHCFTRTGTLIVETMDAKCVLAVADINSLLNVPN